MLLRTALGALAAVLVCTGTAQASSLVYIKDCNARVARSSCGRPGESGAVRCCAAASRSR